jgi:SAM-dependent methyltransferase
MSSDKSTKRFPPLPGLDYKRGARAYAANLSAGERDHLATKPFYNLAIKMARDGAGGIDADTYRHFCDFANFAKLLALPPASRILEVGCGSGWLCEYLARFGFHVTGLDISSALIDIAGQRLAKVAYGVDSQTPLRARFLTHDIESAPLPEKFDVLICYDSLHHFADEHAVMRHFAAMLDHGGMLCVVEGEAPPPDSAAADNLRAVMHATSTLESPFARDYLLDLLDQHGFAVVGDYVSINGLFDRSAIAENRFPSVTEPVNYFLCKKICDSQRASLVPTSHEPAVLRAGITTGVAAHGINAKSGAPFEITLLVENLGDTLWLVDPAAPRGTVRLGVKMLTESGAIIEEFHGKPALLHAVAPRETVTLRLRHHAPRQAGHYRLHIDLIDQEIAWFEQRGSAPLIVEIRVDN